MQKSTRIVGAAILVLAALSILIWYAAWLEDRHALLTVSFLDIGQGDSIFIQAPSGTQVLIDGGPGSTVMRRLSQVMPWYDHSLDVIIPTHPDADHISGLIDVLKRYQISYVLQSSVLGSTPTWNSLEGAIADDAKSGTKVITAERGRIINLGKGAYLEILSPDRELLKTDTNTACVVTHLVYGKTSFMLGCDAPQMIENYLVSLDGKNLKSDVLKAGHHGSRTSSSPLWVGYVDPSYAVYSRGCDNKYGHPHAETIATFARFNIPTEDTCKLGTITFVSDGNTVRLK
ncbi:MBL fold metallo-hydrolase [Candidatus Kaiserbacteria bacterium]|nr:MBL fold metallo-hydrolase [Candidatus Kaiserbacteria bacterium]